MFGVEKLRENARPFVDGEEVRECVVVRSGTLHQQNHALVATEEHLWALRLRWPGFTAPAEVLMKLPLDNVEVELSGPRVIVRELKPRRVYREWKRLNFRDPKPLAEYVSSRAPS